MFNYDTLVKKKILITCIGCYGKTVVELEPTANFPQDKINK